MLKIAHFTINKVTVFNEKTIFVLFYPNAKKTASLDENTKARFIYVINAIRPLL